MENQIRAFRNCNRVCIVAYNNHPFVNTDQSTRWKQEKGALCRSEFVSG